MPNDAICAGIAGTFCIDPLSTRSISSQLSAAQHILHVIAAKEIAHTWFAMYRRSGIGKNRAHTPINVVRGIADEMRDTEGDPANGGPATGGLDAVAGAAAARHSRSRVVVEALGDELGELLHPHRRNSRARRRARPRHRRLLAVQSPPSSGDARRWSRRPRRADIGVAMPRVARGRHSAASQCAGRWA